MRRRIDGNDPEFDRLFTAVRRSWFRLETLQQYDADYERQEFAAFLRGEPIDLTPGPDERMLREHVAAGRRLVRVHVIEEPHTDYIKYELAAYRRNVDAGEEVRVIGVPRGEWPAGIPRHDYWLFDDADLWLMRYGPAGELEEVEQSDDSDEIERHRRWRDAALAQSVSVADYAAALA